MKKKSNPDIPSRVTGKAITAEIMDIMGGSNALLGRGSLEGREDAR